MPIFAITFILLYSIGCLSALFIDPSFGVFLYLVEYFINPASRWWYGSLPDLRYSYSVSLCILIGYLIRHKKYSDNHLFKVPQTKWWLAMIMLMIVISPIAVWPQMHQKILQSMLKLSLFAIFAYKLIDTPKKFERMIWSYLTGNFYIGWVAYTVGRNSDDRLEGIGGADGGDGNCLAAIFTTCVPLLLFYVVEGKNWQKIISVIFLAYIINGIILTNSRGAFLGLAASLLYLAYFILFKSCKSTRTKIQMILIFIFGIILFLRLADTTFWERMNTLNEVHTTEEGTLTGGGAARTYFWMKGVEVVKKYPLGVGGWGFQFLSPQYLPPESLTQGMRALHSTYFQSLVELGYLGIIIFLCLLTSNFNALRKIRGHFYREKNNYLFYQSVTIGAGFVAFLTASVFIDMLYAEVLYWFILFSACFNNIYIIKSYSLSIEKDTE